MFFYLKFFLKCPSLLGFSFPYYNIPRKIRELQHKLLCAPTVIIITYQEKSGNYNLIVATQYPSAIITYQEKSGNYNQKLCHFLNTHIITYQEKSGNYNTATAAAVILTL